MLISNFTPLSANELSLNRSFSNFYVIPKSKSSPAILTMILRVALPNINFYPNSIKNEKTGEWSGVYIDFLEELKKKANFSYSLVTNNLNSYDDAGDEDVQISLYIAF